MGTSVQSKSDAVSGDKHQSSTPTPPDIDMDGFTPVRNRKRKDKEKTTDPMDLPTTVVTTLTEIPTDPQIIDLLTPPAQHAQPRSMASSSTSERMRHAQKLNVFSKELMNDRRIHEAGFARN